MPGVLLSKARKVIANSTSFSFRSGRPLQHGMKYILSQGLVSITISAVLPSLRPPPCPTQENCKEASTSQLWVLYICLLLTSLGTGGIRPCVVPFAANQFDMTRSTVARTKLEFLQLVLFQHGNGNTNCPNFHRLYSRQCGMGLGSWNSYCRHGFIYCSFCDRFSSL
ncbi:hypothetical protein L1049_001134 [Liquidambar formosana]|uniref:Uncharacterized protein n=1 Tax=Liquidambar formosana TaxID=63359 RepID=A0AAP0NAY6_LIQFO